jgi:hypothetical protein
MVTFVFNESFPFGLWRSSYKIIEEGLFVFIFDVKLGVEMKKLDDINHCSN